jgi:hypothetical protein
MTIMHEMRIVRDMSDVFMEGKHYVRFGVPSGES